MRPLDLNVINSQSPYTVWKQNERYYFRTDYDIVYTVSFDEEDAFVDDNPDILLYICDSSNDQQAQRDRLFLSWFNSYGKDRFSILTALVTDENEENYIAMILLKEHPHYDAIAKRFNEEIAMFKENK